VAAECASIAAHGPDAPECRSGAGHRLCGHVTIAGPPAPAWTAPPGPRRAEPGTGQ
jgi:hypothetical protein